MEYHTPICPFQSSDMLLQRPHASYSFCGSRCGAAAAFSPSKEMRERQIRQDQLRKLQNIEERKHFALFIRILCHQIKKGGDLELLYTVEQTVRICNKRHALGDPIFVSQMDSIIAALRPQVGEVNWSRALRYLRYYDRKSAKESQS